MATDTEISERYGLRLKRLRGEAGLTQREVADALGVDHKAIVRAERGQASEEVLVPLERLYGVRESYPSAPRHPVRRRGWFDRRNSTMRAKPPPSGIFGAGKPPEAA